FLLITLVVESLGFHNADGQQISMGESLWAIQNLNVDTFRNGDKIYHAQSNEEWLNASREGIPAWCYYENNAAYGKKNGRIYNWYAVNDSRILAPTGWEIPSVEIWNQML